MLTAVAGIAGLLFLCWLVFTLAVNALPVFVAVSVGIFVSNYGAGAVGAAFVGIGTGALTMAIGRFVFATSQARTVRGLVATAFTVPAALAGYNLVSGLVSLADLTEIWRRLFGVAGALIVGGAAWLRLNALQEVA